MVWEIEEMPSTEYQGWKGYFIIRQREEAKAKAEAEAKAKAQGAGRGRGGRTFGG